MRHIVVSFLVLVLSGCSASSDDLLGTVNDFTLTERSGRAITRGDLAGKVWVAAFTFTRCGTSCPRITHSLARLQQALFSLGEVRFVTISVDPDYDTPEVLRRYAESFGANAEQWLFLTGPRDDVYRLISAEFKLHAAPAEGEARRPGNEVIHATKLAVVDPQGRIRGYYDGLDEADLTKLTRHVRLLVWQYRLPGVNALLNATSGLLLLLGYAAVRTRRIPLHKGCMLAALLVSALFLASYLYYHVAVRGGEPTRFRGPDTARLVYLAVLLSHTILAVVVAPLALFTAYQGLRANLVRHVKVARWTLPLWLYVSATGVIVYVMLYRLYPPG